MRIELEKALLDAGLIYPSDYPDKILEYYQLLIRWNQKTNLTTLTEPQDFIYKHILDSLYPAKFLAPGTLVDVGSGAGFPGLPLKMLQPMLMLTMLEASAKKVAFLEHCSRELAVEAEIIHGRAEEFGRTSARESFDFATVRAVGPLAIICEYCLPLLKKGGVLIAFKGPGGEAELGTAKVAIDSLGGSIQEILNYKLPMGDQRSLIMIEKVRATPNRFPRRPGIPAKKPL